MSFVIYGLRLKGALEVRYIGQTNQMLDLRLRGHFSTAKKMPIPEPRCVWLLEHEAEIEAVALAYAPTRHEARAVERHLIEAFVAVGHRLFNRHHVVPHARIHDGPEMAARRARYMIGNIGAEA